MPRQVVFLVHGIGDHKKGWSKPVVKYLDTVGERYASVEGPISDQVVFKEIAYGDVFDKQLARWDADVDAVAANPTGPFVVKVCWIEGQSWQVTTANDGTKTSDWECVRTNL